MKQKKWRYHVSHSWTEVSNGHKHSAITQLYQIGVYMIVDNNPAMQYNCKPQDLAKIELRLINNQTKGEIKDLEFGREIIVTEENGFYKDITNEVESHGKKDDTGKA